jgi:transcription antitermination factor NusG
MAAACQTRITLFPWYAVQVRPRSETVVAQTLANKQLHVFCPTYPSRRRWSDRHKTLQVALFPGYLFCGFDPARPLAVLTTPNVIQIVGLGKTPVPVDPAEIAAVHKIIDSGFAARPWPFLRIGQRIRIDHGALDGLEGFVVSEKGVERLVVSVTLLQRSVAVEIDRDAIEPVPRFAPIRPAADGRRASSAAQH